MDLQIILEIGFDTTEKELSKVPHSQGAEFGGGLRYPKTSHAAIRTASRLCKTQPRLFMGMLEVSDDPRRALHIHTHVHTYTHIKNHLKVSDEQAGNC